MILAIGALYFSATFGQYAINMTLLAGFMDVPPIDGIYWSLYVEIQFYPYVALLIASNQIKRIEVWLWAWLAAAMLAHSSGSYRLQMLTISDFSCYFSAGAVRYRIRQGGVTLARCLLLLAAWAQAIFMCLVNLAPEDGTRDLAYIKAVVTIVVSLFFVVMLLVALRRTGFFATRSWLMVGSLTYPLYLLHQNIGYAIFNADYPEINRHLLFWATIALMLLAFHGVHAAIERPFATPFKRTLNRRLELTQSLMPGWVLRIRYGRSLIHAVERS